MGAFLNPIKSHVNSFGSFLFDGAIEKPAAVGLSTQIKVGGWVCLSSARVVRIRMASWPLMKLAPILASAAEAMILEIILEIVKRGLLIADSPDGG